MRISSDVRVFANTNKMQKFSKPSNLNFKSRYDDECETSIFDVADEWQRNMQIEESSSGYYQDEITLARKLIGEDNLDKRRESIYADRYRVLKEEKAVLDGFMGRAIFGLLTVGASEVVRARDVANCSSKAKKWVDKIELIRLDLINARANETAADASNQNRLNDLRVKYVQANAHIKENVIRPKFLDLIQAQKEGFQVEIPNCVMFVNKDDNISEQFINWAIREANVNSRKIDIFEDDLLDTLDSAEKNYQNTGRWNLIYVKNMDKAINPNVSDMSVIESMKAVMTLTAQDYHTTLIFCACDPQQLDEISIEPNRVKKIDITPAFDIDRAYKETMLDGLNNEEYVKNSPLCAINDMLTISGGEKYKLDFDKSNKKDIENAREYLVKHLTSLGLEGYISILNKAIENAWYIVG